MTTEMSTESTTTTITREYTPRPIPQLMNRPLPWTGLTTGAADLSQGETLTSGQLLERAGLDWEVGIRPLYRRVPLLTGANPDPTAPGYDARQFEFMPHPTARETFRKTDDHSLGVVRGHYEPFSNQEIFAFGDGIVENGVGRWVHAGQQAGGSSVFMTMLLREFEVLGGNPYQLYAFFRAGHGGSVGLNAWLVPFAVACTNQMAMVNAANRGHWAIQHTRNIRDRVEEAKRSLAMAVDYEAQFRALAEQMAKQAVSDQKVQAVLDLVVPKRRGRRDDMIADLRYVYETSATVDPFKGTAWGLLMAITEGYDHVKPQRNDNARFESIMVGEGAKARARALKNLAGMN